MLFNSLIFLIFLPIVFFGYWFVFKNLRVQNFFIVIASYFFYGWWDWRFLILILLTTFTCFTSGILLSRQRSAAARRWICGINIGFNLGLLCFFKYFNFFSENLRILFTQFGYQLDWFTLDVLLPVGISFYTFQAISYPIDVYRGQVKPTKDFIAFTGFISFFPQLVAGPIERSTQLLPQFLKKRTFNYYDAVDGMRQILWGMFKKVVIADNCAFLANKVFENYGNCGSLELIIGACAFSFQIYGDFSGYSDIAVGVAKLFGIRLNMNFHYPYFSRNIAEFWRRWHISLNTWFRDYVYIPLGGGRDGVYKKVRNVFIVFALSGLWHGANWTFIVWGIYCWLLFLPLILFAKNYRYKNIVASNRSLPSFKEIGMMLSNFCLVTIGWIIFRSENLEDGFRYIGRCFSTIGDNYDFTLEKNEFVLAYTALMILVMLVMEWTARKRLFALQVIEGKPLLVRWGTYFAICFFILIFTGQMADFIYFQF